MGFESPPPEIFVKLIKTQQNAYKQIFYLFLSVYFAHPTPEKSIPHTKTVDMALYWVLGLALKKVNRH